MKHITNAFQYTNDTILRWFQNKISHRILATNEYLLKIKIKDSKLCTFCYIVPESLIHLFVDCLQVENVWYQGCHSHRISKFPDFPLTFP